MSASVFFPLDKQQVVGVIGGGQLGRMLALAARRMGVRSVIWTGGLEAPAVECADEVIDLPFDSAEALEQFCAIATVATVEFENIPLKTLEGVRKCIGIFPSPEAVGICQNREREKNFLKENDIPCTEFRVVEDVDSLAKAMAEIGGAGVLKTASFGYDGKGQLKIEGGEDPADVWKRFGGGRAVLEAWVPFEKEISVMVVRNSDGEIKTYDPAENRHREHVLDVSIIPARISEKTASKAQEIAGQIAEAMDYQGILGVEFFVNEDGSLLVNEMAPRPHNSGHHTLDACATSQFEQQLRVALDLPLGSTKLLSPCVMLNLLADFWPDETEPPDWTSLLGTEGAVLHLYGKRRAKELRKMGHATLLGDDVEELLTDVRMLKDSWLE
ncbi:MAG: 5-(carboxyamino)imidazole ribonucleotide synthase [Akkermansiaceae bacterium]|jgi:5-(carboxyamino)imidazole ribonucleotide synthase|nr:5-(carboxyamino)imidazole ribonucleotide synthase [Akkermansiaceae bacterium]MDP4722659.1 5-(carboxyamino)imidazole ribonucleotide synthase [Akkermansiaceae bacterium]MDP4846925.1 5-(carboxyamino)imidazole ribonucleotide synthase [Akkermansiaceae bacterium]